MTNQYVVVEKNSILTADAQLSCVGKTPSPGEGAQPTSVGMNLCPRREHTANALFVAFPSWPYIDVSDQVQEPLCRLSFFAFSKQYEG